MRRAQRSLSGPCGLSRLALLSLALQLSLPAAGYAFDAKQDPSEITRGAWAGTSGADTFLFALRGTPPDSLVGTVHVMRDGRMESEIPITRASYRPPDLEMYIERTGVTYRGRVDLAGRRVSGRLSYGEQEGPRMELRQIDPARIPGFAPTSGTSPYGYRRPSAGGDGWAIAWPEEAGLDRDALETMVEAVIQGDAGLLHSLLVVRDGRLVLEEYFHGYGPDDLHRLASATKSVSSLLVGAAIDRGLIAGVEAPLLRLLGRPQAPTGSRWNDETLADLLTMTMGLDWSHEELETVHGTGPEFFRRVLDRKVAAIPGTQFEYASPNVNLLAGVIFEATGQHAESFAREALFGPLGIESYDWAYGRQSGFNLMDGSLQLRPRDLAKIGALFEAGGRWAGTQVLSGEWIEASGRTHVRTGGDAAFSGYGYLWWTGELPTGHGAEPVVLANGWGSQFVLVFPGLDLVVVTTGGNEDNGRHLDFGLVLTRTLLPSL